MVIITTRKATLPLISRPAYLAVLRWLWWMMEGWYWEHGRVSSSVSSMAPGAAVCWLRFCPTIAETNGGYHSATLSAMAEMAQPITSVSRNCPLKKTFRSGSTLRENQGSGESAESCSLAVAYCTNRHVVNRTASSILTCRLMVCIMFTKDVMFI